MRRIGSAALVLIAVAVLASALPAEAKKHKRPVKSHVLGLTSTVTTTSTNPNSLAANGTISGRPFGSGTDTRTGTGVVDGGGQFTSQHTDLVWTFARGTVFATDEYVAGQNEVVRVTRGTGAYRRLRPAQIAVRVISTSGLTGTARFAGTVRY